jgi:hypothetical protein
MGKIVHCRGLQSGAAAETDGEIERYIVSILHERMHQIGRFRDDSTLDWNFEQR